MTEPFQQVRTVKLDSFTYQQRASKEEDEKKRKKKKVQYSVHLFQKKVDAGWDAAPASEILHCLFFES
ncbi:hypothetical protein CIHG_08845 [Coccidioides immitis H538.4]|uniref:Uncharacterized protein n=2 Tax=Coccidioides immitis TaxID=5501 RepID=A0A0J8S0P2_COCIT|nr:hypothetical protein CIRG_04740 [Coccidioides immitis RMSCC 2394]KMU90990.1 hypothetical protein CIHG_08845 [Coccidioides immitis H538.4]